MSSVQIDQNESDLIQKYVEDHPELRKHAPDFAVTDEDKDAFVLAHIVMCATMYKAKHGNIGDLDKYPKPHTMPDTMKERLRDTNPSTYSKEKLLKKLRIEFNLEEDEIKQIHKGDLKDLYFNICLKLLTFGDEEVEQNEKEDDYALPISKQIELDEQDELEKKLKKAAFTEAVAESKTVDGTHVSFEDAMAAMEGLDDLDSFLDDEED